MKSYYEKNKKKNVFEYIYFYFFNEMNMIYDIMKCQVCKIYTLK